MEVEHAEVGALCVEDDELGDAVGAHEVEGVHGVFRLEDALWVVSHDVGGCEAFEGEVALDHAAKVAVRDDSEGLGRGVVGAVGYHGAAEALGCHFKDGFADGCVGGDDGALVLSEEVAHAHIELFAEGSAGVEACEVASGEVAAFDECHGEGVTHDELCRGAAGGCEVVGTGFVLHGGVEYDVGLVGEE